MEEHNTQKIIFIFPEELTIIELIDEILNNYGLEESEEEFVDKDEKGIEPRAIIIRDAAITMYEKRISEKKTIELLSKHLKTSTETAENIANEIKKKLIPYARKAAPEIELENPQKPLTPTSPIENPLKKPEFLDVEDNAKNIKIHKGPVVQELHKLPKKDITPPPQNSGPDSYREEVG